MADYTRAIASALRMITKYGQSVTLVKFADTTPDSSQPWRTGAPTESTQTVFGVFQNYDLVSRGGSRHIQGELILAGDKKFLIAASGLTNPPTPKGEIRVSSIIWKIVSVEELAPSGTPIMYSLQVRQ